MAVVILKVASLGMDCVPVSRGRSRADPFRDPGPTSLRSGVFGSKDMFQFGCIAFQMAGGYE